jgi:hypothetical protein
LCSQPGLPEGKGKNQLVPGNVDSDDLQYHFSPSLGPLLLLGQQIKEERLKIPG